MTMRPQISTDQAFAKKVTPSANIITVNPTNIKLNLNGISDQWLDSVSINNEAVNIVTNPKYNDKINNDILIRFSINSLHIKF